jgi:hypothetical protein
VKHKQVCLCGRFRFQCHASKSLNHFHTCICIFRKPCYATIHPCLCRQDSNYCKASDDSHVCLCNFWITRNSLCTDSSILQTYNPKQCRALVHHQLCLCSYNIKICSSIRDHLCMCNHNNNKNNNRTNRIYCRQHKTFEIWNEWESSTNSYLYWIPEEVLFDILSLLLQK